MTTIASPQRGGTASVDVEGALRAAGAAHLSSSGQAYLAGRLEARQNFAFVEDRSFNLGGLRDVDGPVAARKREGLASFATLDDAAHALVQVAYRAAPRRWAEVGDAEMAALDAYPTRAPRETFRKLMADWEAFDRMRVGEAVLPAARADSVAWREARDAFLTRGLPSDAGHTARAADEALKREVLRARAVRRELRIVSVVDVYDPRGGVSKSAAAGLARHVPNAVTFLGHGLTIWWLLGGPWIAGAAGLLCDDVDGWLARKLGACSRFGGTYDWAVDVTLSSVLLAELGLLPLATILVPIQVWRKEFGPPVGPLQSSRAALTVGLMVKRALAGRS